MVDNLLRATDADAPSEARRDIRREWPAWLILAALWLFSLWAKGQLPARVPIHWNLRGEVDGWGSPLMATLMLPTLATATYLITLAYDWGRIDFKAARAMSPTTTRQIRIIILMLLACLQGLILRAAMSGGLLHSSWIMMLIFLFFVGFGNLMPRLEPNAWAGIRIPPTLESREVWKRTHRMGGRWFIATGLLGMPLSLLPEPIATFFTLPLILLPVLGSVIYAYRLRAACKS